jgi:dethiobiotin synthetase
VTGTDTGVGKTILSGALLSAMAAAGERVSAYKPVLTGLQERSGVDGSWPSDDVLLGSAAGMSPEDVAPVRYDPPVSPHLAAELALERIDPARLLRGARAAHGAALVVEGVGGLFTPLSDDFAVSDLAAALGLPVLIAARPGLGTINHTLLTVRAARGAGLDVRAVVLTPWPEEPSRMELSNRQTVARLGAVEVHGLGIVGSPDPADLARAGQALPWRAWLGEPQSGDPARAAATTASVTVASSSASITYGGIV